MENSELLEKIDELMMQVDSLEKRLDHQGLRTPLKRRFLNICNLLFRKQVVLPALAVTLVLATSLATGTISIPHTFSPNTVISSSAVNENFTTLVNQINTNTSNIPAAASQAEAELGTENTKYMTPLRTQQAFIAQEPIAFRVILGSSQLSSVSKLAWTTAEIDTTDGALDLTTNYRFTVNKAGKYFLYANARFMAVPDGEWSSVAIYKNGSILASSNSSHGRGVGFDQADDVSTITDASVGDYFEVFVASTTAVTVSANTEMTYFMGYLLR